MAYNKGYLKDHDVDWFCVINGTPIHVASAGDNLPKCVNNVAHNTRNQMIVRNSIDMNTNDDIIINEEYVKNVLEINSNYIGDENIKEIRFRYLSSFINMAKKGFMSYDKIVPNDRNDNKYIWIVKPKHFSMEITTPAIIIDGFDFEAIGMELVKIIDKGAIK